MSQSVLVMPQAQTAMAQNFSNAAHGYDAHASLQREVGQRLRAHWPSLSPPATVCDVGCGTGYDAAWLGAENNLHLVDVAPAMLAVAADRCAPVAATLHTHGCDVQQLQQLGIRADAIWSNSMLQWVSNMPVAAAAIHNSLKPNGTVVAALFTRGSLIELKQAWAAVDDKSHVRELPLADEVCTAFESSGLAICWQERLRLRRYFHSFSDIRAHLRGLGASNVEASRRKGLTTKGQLAKLLNALEEKRDEQGLPVTWEVLMFKAEKW